MPGVNARHASAFHLVANVHSGRACRGLQSPSVRRQGTIMGGLDLDRGAPVKPDSRVAAEPLLACPAAGVRRVEALDDINTDVAPSSGAPAHVLVNHGRFPAIWRRHDGAHLNIPLLARRPAAGGEHDGKSGKDKDESHPAANASMTRRSPWRRAPPGKSHHALSAACSSRRPPAASVRSCNASRRWRGRPPRARRRAPGPRSARAEFSPAWRRAARGTSPSRPRRRR